MMNVNYFIRLSFDKLETFDVNRSSLSTFVLVRNGLISALTEQKNKQHYYHDDDDEDDEMDDIILEEEYYLYDEEEEEEKKEEEEYNEEIAKEIEQEESIEKGKVWLDSCFDQLEEDGQLQEEQERPVTKPDESEDSDDDDDEAMPLSPQQDDSDDFYNSKPANIYNQALVCFDIPFLSLD